MELVSLADVLSSLLAVLLVAFIQLFGMQPPSRLKHKRLTQGGQNQTGSSCLGQ